MAGRTPALQQNWQSSEKSQHFKEKNPIFNKPCNWVIRFIQGICVKAVLIVGSRLKLIGQVGGRRMRSGRKRGTEC